MRSRCALLDRRVLPHHELHGVAGEVEQAERDERDDHHHQRGLQDAAEDEGEHDDRGLSCRPERSDGNCMSTGSSLVATGSG